MAISELQVGLIGAGGVVVVGIFAFNKWQERKHRKQMDALASVEPLGNDSPGRSSSDRLEPVIGADAPVRAQPSAQDVRDASARRVSPALPLEVDERADWGVRIEAIKPVVAGRLCQAATEQLDGIAKPLRWFGFSDSDNRWDAIDVHSAASYHWVCVALQLVDRRGPATDADMTRLAAGLQRLCDNFMAIPSLPAKGDALDQAAELDRLCAGVDIQIGVNVVARDHAFAGSKLRGLAEAAGLELLGDGCFHARNELGVTQFVLSNLEPVLFEADAMRTLTTQGVTLTLDVPRVADGVRVFERMMSFAQQLADGLNGAVVDDNRSPFGDKAVGLIRAQIDQYQGQMVEQGIAPGSSLALRLFS
ncbi:cell division protein ZipA C-terminal FtsZ-binding domain-containing protein [Zoogloea sp.]|uniref:cell division protein ZipA C-terminal FtsZ-binding domain-containing protein n=1 Tax=Zoogloea sp. TaxID=49181 RepID=UPI00262DDE93|nr:cell division protein ZipA C-terminal FtsZ-binding domain-containing protein [Zoogloea sp.]